MFDDFAKKMEELGLNVPKVFETVAQKGANYFENSAKETTDRLKVVDTGNYKRNWNAEVIEIGNNQFGIVCMNNVEYASFLEDGYNINSRHFVPFDKMQGSPKTSKLIAEFKTKYPNAKGFIAKPRRFKGLKIGRLSMTDTENYVIQELQKEIKIAMLQKSQGISRGEAKKML